jgi:transcriptional regulator with XRE-family HTH domain
MRRKEDKFVSEEVKAAARRLAPVIRTARLARNMTQGAAAERARMSAYTWMKIERGDVSVSMGAWFSALECLGLLDALVLSPELSVQPRPATVRLRARSSAAKRDAFDF